MSVVDFSGNAVRSQSDYVESRAIENIDSGRLKPRWLGTGNTRGAQTVGYGGTKIDGTNNRISVTANNSTLNLGDLSDTDTSTGLSVSDGSAVERLRAGSFPDGTVKIKLSQATYDVSTATDDQLIWSSDFNLFKIVQTGTTTVDLAAGYGSYTEYTSTITHDLGSTPMILGSVDFPPATLEGRFMLPMTLVESSGGTNGVGAFFRVNTDNFVCTVKARNSGSDVYKGVYTFRYYILKETAA